MASKAVNTLRAELQILRDQVVEINTEYEDQKLPDEVRDRWNRLNATIEDYEKRVEVLVRQERVDELSRSDENTEVGADPFQIRRPSAPADPYDLSDAPRDGTEGKFYRERAKYAIDEARFPHTSREAAQEHVEKLLDENDGDEGRVSRHLLITGSPTYKKAFGKYLMGHMLNGEESRSMIEVERAMSLTGSAGGFAVPFELDPTVIPTSNLAVNPYRSISRVENITVDEWRGVSSGAITAAYAAEATAAGDNAPTLAQPTISTEKAQAFIPYSIEIGMDWNGLQAEMGRLLQDSKDELEATKFTLGNGTNEPFGVITGATTVFTAAGTNVLVVADIYGLEAALPPRFRSRASMVMNRLVAQKIRQFDTAGGANLWIDNLKTGLQNNVPLGGAFGANLLGYPTYESSAMSGTFTTGQLIGVLGDFRYYCIVDRIGLTVEAIPHLFDVTNNRPTGQRGLYCYWRNGAKVLDANAFRTLKLA